MVWVKLNFKFYFSKNNILNITVRQTCNIKQGLKLNQLLAGKNFKIFAAHKSPLLVNLWDSYL